MRKIEICCGSLEDVKLAIEFDIDSIELNTSLSLGGMTPTIATLRSCKRITEVPIYCMNRPVPGGFVYNDIEYEVMLEDGKILLENGADGLVFGILNEDLTIDQKRTREMIELAHSYGKQAIFHMAMDVTKDLLESYRILLGLGIDRVLTRGAGKNAVVGLDNLRKLNAINSDKILVGAGVNGETIHHFDEFKYVHGSCKHFVYRNNGQEEVVQDHVGRNLMQQVNPDCVEALVKYVKR